MIILLFLVVNLFCDFPGNRFQFVVLKYKGEWKRNISGIKGILDFLEFTTSIDPYKEIKILDLKSKDIFYYPFLFMTGRGDFSFNRDERENLKIYLERGGFLWVDSSGDSSFISSLEREFKLIFPQKKFLKIPKNSAIFYSFYLLPQVGGRIRVSDYLYGIDIGGRWAVVLSKNDFTGSWSIDNMGRWLYECVPDGEKQRWEGMKLTVNIIMYSLCGTYKLDKIHQPFIERKLR
mgnify:CR=1 FL=1